MFVVRVLPIKKGLKKEALSYFSKEPVAVGALIKVPVRGREYFALVAGCDSAESLKAEIKASPFALRKTASFKTEKFFSESWQEAVKKTARYFAAPLGEVMFAMIPALVLENLENIKKCKSASAGWRNKTQAKIKEILIHQAEEEERILNYKSAVREAFARKSSVFISLPTKKGLVEIKNVLEKGIEEYTFTFFADMPKKEFLKTWKKAIETNHPILVIASPIWSILPRDDLQTIILDKENAAGWKTFSRPHIDLRKFMETYAEASDSKIILGDTVLRVETLWRYKNGEWGEFERVKWRGAAARQPETFLVEMRKPEGRGKNYQSNFKAVGEELLSLIAKSGKENKNIFIYTARKGLAPVTVCRDCGEEVVCNNCSSPVVLYSREKSNVFHCHQCGETRSAREFCKKCGSWRLVALGVGIEKVVEEIREQLPGLRLFQIHKEAVADDTAAETAKKFYATPGSVLAGTEMAFQYLKEPVDYTAVASIDPLFFVPDFRIREKIFRIALNTKLLAKEKCLIQIRKAERETLSLALAGNIADFYKMEIKEREALRHPPFSVFIKITVRGTPAFVSKESQRVENIFQPWQPTIFSSIHERKGRTGAANCVIKIPRENWPNSDLLKLIASLSPYFEVKIDPDNLL